MFSTFLLIVSSFYLLQTASASGANDDVVHIGHDDTVRYDILSNDMSIDGVNVLDAEHRTSVLVLEPLNTLGITYVPFSPEHSGILDQTNSYGNVAGRESHSVTLTDDDLSTGWVEFQWDYDAGGSLGHGSEIDLGSFSLEITLDDFDFDPTTYKNTGSNSGLYLILSETMTISLTEHPSASLTIDDSNYGHFRKDGFGKTNNRAVDYSFNLENDFGVTQDMLTTFEETGVLHLTIKMSCSLTTEDKDKKRTNTKTLTNGPDMIDANPLKVDVTTVIVPQLLDGQNAACGHASIQHGTGLFEYTSTSSTTCTESFQYQVCETKPEFGSQCTEASITVHVDGQDGSSLDVIDDVVGPHGPSGPEVDPTLDEPRSNTPNLSELHTVFTPELTPNLSLLVYCGASSASSRAFKCNSGKCFSSSGPGQDGSSDSMWSPVEGVQFIFAADTADASIFGMSVTNQVFVSHTLGATWSPGQEVWDNRLETAAGLIQAGGVSTLVPFTSTQLSSHLDSAGVVEAGGDIFACPTTSWWMTENGVRGYVQGANNDINFSSSWDCECSAQ